MAEEQKKFSLSELESDTLIQVIDKDGIFREPDVLNEKVAKWDFLKVGFDYCTVAILGCQSSGKSTLLNLLFNTQFAVMDSSKGRSQTTLGVWLGHSKLNRHCADHTILVFDIEGVDSRERGEEQAGFEKKTSLFSLALAQVLIVNMWHTDVGRYNAGNSALLKTVFELNLQLFDKKEGQKTTILFIIRDHIPEDTPLERLQDTLMQEMGKIWASLIKPEKAKTSLVTDYFSFQFTALPHKVLKPDDFKQQANGLKERFFDPQHQGFLFRSEKFDIPADGFTTYASRIWETITSNKDLDLPTEKEMLAMYRCDEIQETCFRKFSEGFSPIKESLRRGNLVEKLGEKGTELFRDTLKQYDEPAARYHPEVAKKKRETLIFNMNSEFQPVFTQQIMKLKQQTITSFEDAFEKELPKGKAARNFKAITEKIEKDTLSHFETIAKESVIDSNQEWDYEEDLEELKQKLTKHIKNMRAEQLVALMEEMKELFKKNWGQTLEKMLDNAKNEMWPKVREMYSTSKEKAREELIVRLKEFEVSDKEEENKLEELKEVGFNLLKSKFKEKAKQLDFTMLKKFESKFNLDDQGLPRRWKQTDKISDYLITAREFAEGLLEVFSFLRLEESHDSITYLAEESPEEIDSELIILTWQEAQNIKEKFKTATETAYIQAVRDQESLTTTAHIPVYMLLLLVVLGWNEFWHILTSPILLFFTIILVVAGYVIYLLNLGGYAKQVAGIFLQTSMAGVQNVVQDLVQQTQTGASGVSAEKKNQ